MIAAIQQPHYFPWLGYFDKMAKVDVFVLMDEVQLEKRSQMTRNRIISPAGEIKYITISSNQQGHREKKYREIPTVDNTSWKRSNLALLREYYRKAPFAGEILERLELFYERDYQTLCEWTTASIVLIKDWLKIPTRLVFQSSVDYNREKKRSDLILEICLGVGADTYVAGRGASVSYLDRDAFAENNVSIVFQNFQHPVYPQINTREFISGVSVLDLFFNSGIEGARALFWETVNQSVDVEILHLAQKMTRGGVNSQT